MSGRPRGEQGFALVEISSIVLDTTSLAATDSTYRADSALIGVAGSQTCGPLTGGLHTVTDGDRPGRPLYRVDTYIVLATPAGGTSVKTVVVRSQARAPRSPASSRPRASTSSCGSQAAA